MTKAMSAHSKTLVAKLWNYCNLLRDDGLSYGDYVEQLTYLLFLKMAHERTEAPWNEESRIPAGSDWPSFLEKDGRVLEEHYAVTLTRLGREPGLLGLIFRKAQNKIQDPAKLKRLIVDLIDSETWMGVDADVKGDAYEGLLEKNASDTKSGAGQYFTPRALIRAMVDCVQPVPGEIVADPACGTGGFLLAGRDYVFEHNDLDRSQKRFLRDKTFRGIEIVDNTARLCAMNLFLHGILDPPIEVRDALLAEPKEKVDVVLANPPFGKKSSITIAGEDGKAGSESQAIVRQDFWATTSNKQLNFVQHIRSMLKVGGRTAVVVPDNVLFEGGAGETIRRRLLEDCNVHTLLRLPTGIFYAQGVKANVIFFERRAASAEPATNEMWVFDLRTNKHFTLKTQQMTRADLDEFVKAFRPGKALKQRKESERFKKWTFGEVSKRDGFNLDVWAGVNDESLTHAESLPAPEVIAEEIVEHLSSALAQFESVASELRGDNSEREQVRQEDAAVEELLMADATGHKPTP
jgi:type I restriction enzyme M protein